MHRILLFSMLLSASSPAQSASPDAGIRRAFQFAYPIDRMICTRQVAISSAAASGATAINAFRHRARLATPADRAVTTPNNDTLYSAAWIDLRSGPVILRLPALRDRYHSVALMTMRTDNFAVLGTGKGGGGGQWVIVPPGWQGRTPAAMRRIPAPGIFAWAIVRIVVSGDADLPKAAAAQQLFTLIPLNADQANPIPMTDCSEHSPSAMLERVNAILGQGPVDAQASIIARRLRPFGIYPGKSAVFAGLDPNTKSAWDRLLPTLRAEIAQGLEAQGETRNSWHFPKSNIGRFGTDDAYRAAVALGGLGALPAEEAIYLTAKGSGKKCVKVHFPRQLPVRTQGFWSMTLYEVEPDGRLFFFDNAFHRYAWGDRSPDLVAASDGSIDIDVCPSRSASVNWLPAPKGDWQLVLRIYRPVAANQAKSSAPVLLSP